MFSEMLREARGLYPNLINDRRSLHGFAEVGADLPKTVAFCKERLKEIGIPSKECAGGLIATVGRGERCVLLRADMDALPVREETGLPFAAVNGNMHACGHDMHTAMLLSAAELLHRHEDRLSGSVRLCFQPGEETLSGAKSMIDNGLLDFPTPIAALMIHVIIGCDYKTGAIIIPPEGVGATGADYFSVTVKGEGCHGATPHLGSDPIVCASHMISALSSLVQRELSPDSGAVLTVGTVKAGDAPNAIPDLLVFKGSLRSCGEDDRKLLKERLFILCRDIADAFRCKASVDFFAGTPSFFNNGDLVSSCQRLFEKAEAGCIIIPERARGGASEDFSYVSRIVPSIMLAVSAGERACGYTEPLHSPYAVFDEDALAFGTAAYAAFAIEALNK